MPINQPVSWNVIGALGIAHVSNRQMKQRQGGAAMQDAASVGKQAWRRRLTNAMQSKCQWFCPHTLGRYSKLPQTPQKERIPS